MSRSNIRLAASWLLVVLASLVSPAAQGAPPVPSGAPPAPVLPVPIKSGAAEPSPTARARPTAPYLDVPEAVLKACAKERNPDFDRNFDCGDASKWRSPPYGDLFQAGVSPRFIPLPTPGKSVCDAVAAWNTIDRKVLTDEFGDLLKVCGYVENPLRRLKRACTSLVADPPRGVDVSPLECTEAAGKLRSFTDNDLARRWAGPPNETSVLPSGKTICAAVSKVHGVENDDLEALRKTCGLARERAGFDTALVSFAGPILQGLGDSLKARAKDELIDFGVGLLGKAFCTPDDKSPADVPALVAAFKTIRVTATSGTEDATGTLLSLKADDHAFDDVDVVAKRYTDAAAAGFAGGSTTTSVAISRWVFTPKPGAASLGSDAIRRLRKLAISTTRMTGDRLFPQSCAALYPKGVGNDADLEAIKSGHFQQVLAGELVLLPIRLLEADNIRLRGTTVSTAKDEEEEDKLRVILQILVTKIGDAVTRKIAVLDFLGGLEPAIRAEFGKQGFKFHCKATQTSPMDTPCQMMLFLTIASVTKDAFPRTDDPSKISALTTAQQWVGRAASQFCENYAGEKLGTATCLLSTVPGKPVTQEDLEMWKRLKQVWSAVLEFHDNVQAVVTQYDKAVAGGKAPFEVGVQATSGMATAIDGLTGALTAFATAALKETRTPQEAEEAAKKLERFTKVVTLMDDVLKTASAATKQDFRAVAASLRVVFASDLLTGQLKPEFKKGIFFVLDVAEAKTRDDVKKVFDDAAAPLGSYRAKYSNFRVNLNAYVGVFAGLQMATTKKTAYPSKLPDTGFLQPISAPIGVDFSWPWGQWFHGGLAVFLIDPLALAVSESADKKTTQLGLDGVLAPALAFRLGIARSPVVFILSAREQPLVHSSDCGAKHDKLCWGAPFSGLAGFGVDLPLIGLN